MTPNRSSWPTPSSEDIIKRSRILVIDDMDFPYAALFERDGYNVEKWDDVESLSDLEGGRFDVILLDLQGVGREQSAEEGLGILRHIRTKSPAQLVVAYSNADWPLRYDPFFRMADGVLSKSADYLDFKRVVDELLVQRYSIGFYVSRANDELTAYSNALPRLNTKLQKALRTGNTEPLQRYLRRRVEDEVTVDRVIAVVSAGLSAAGLWSG